MALALPSEEAGEPLLLPDDRVPRRRMDGMAPGCVGELVGGRSHSEDVKI